jgi:hypothetical protein
MTLVTAYFALGMLRKGREHNKEGYMNWASAYRFVTNPLIVYTDSEDFYKFMMKVRTDFQKKTKIFKIERQSLWAFQLIDQIKAVFSQPGYPKHIPNTIMPAYSATQHAKYALVSNAIRDKHFENDFYAWIDIGYFRNSVKYNNFFQLLAPPDIDKNKIAINQVLNYTKGLSPSTIFRQNKVWVAGGMFIGTANLILQFEQLYKRAIDYFLDKKIMNTDQQVLYSLYSQEGRQALKPEIELQLYSPGKYPGDPWFYLGYHCRNTLPKDLCPPNTSNCLHRNTTTATMLK